MPRNKAEMRTTTVRLPRPVYDEAKCLVEKQKGAGAPVSLNDLFTTAVKAYLKMYQRRQIDAAFAAMGEDADYQREAPLMAAEFEYSDWEALKLEDRDGGEGPSYAGRSTR